MNQIKLKYASKEAAEKDLKAKGITPESKGVHSIAYVGLLVDKPATITTKATYLDGYHVDIATENEYKFAKGVEQYPANPKHLFWI